MMRAFFPRSNCSNEPKASIMAQPEAEKAIHGAKVAQPCDAPYRAKQDKETVPINSNNSLDEAQLCFLTGCVAHRIKQGKNIFFPRAEKSGGARQRSLTLSPRDSGDVPSP